MSDRTRSGSGWNRALEAWKRRRWLVTGVMTVALAGCLSFIWSLPPLYRSTATVLLDRKEVAQNFVASAVTGELETRLETINQEILSRGRLQELVTRFDLYPGMRKRGSLEEATDQMRKDIQREIRATEAAGGRPATFAFTLSYRGRDPQTVAQVTNALAALYVEENASLRKKQATGTADFLRGQVAEMKQKLDEQERKLGAQPRTIESDLSALERLNTRLRINSDRQLRDLDRRERLVKDMETSGTVSDGTPGSPGPAPETLAMRLTKLKHELADVTARYSEKHPDVIRVRSEIAALEKRLAAEPEPAPEPKPVPQAVAGTQRKAKDPIAEIDRELRALKEEEQSLRNSIAMFEQRAESAPKRLQDYQQQARDYMALKEQYQPLVKRYEDAQMADSMERQQQAEEFRILDVALPAKSPMAPDRTRFGLVGLIIAVGLAAGALVLAEGLDGSFHSIEDLRAFSKVPVLAGVSHLETEGDRRRRMRYRLIAVAALLILIVVVSLIAYYLGRGNEGLVRVLLFTGTR
jgi:polysaccharide biosynthesis transport protein